MLKNVPQGKGIRCRNCLALLSNELAINSDNQDRKSECFNYSSVVARVRSHYLINLLPEYLTLSSLGGRRKCLRKYIINNFIKLIYLGTCINKNDIRT